MRRTLLIPIFAAAVALGCPRDKKASPRDTTPIDTTPADLSGLGTSLPPAAPDTFRPRTPPGGRTGPSVPAAPAALMEAVQREQAFTRFCFQEKGQKSDPSLQGNVAMLVTVGANGVTGARVGDANWSSNAGRAVNQCLNERAGQAWRLTPGAVRPGQYVVQLSFTG